MFDLHEIVNSLLRTMKGIVPCSIDNINTTAFVAFQQQQNTRGLFYRIMFDSTSTNKVILLLHVQLSSLYNI